jgi:hypothetical protein
MSYLSFENNIIEASGNLILKSTSGSIDCSGATISNVTIAGNMVVTSIEPSNNDISFNGSNLLDVSFIQVNNDVSCSSLLVDTIGSTNHDISFNNSNLLDVSSIQVNNDVSCSSLIVDTISSNSDLIVINKDVRINASLDINDGNVTLIHTKDLDISDNIIGLNRGHTSGANNTSGMLINYDVSNIFFGYHKDKNAFVIADTSYNHDDIGRTIEIDNYVDLKVGNLLASNDIGNYFKTIIDSSNSYLELNKSTSTCQFGYANNSNNALHILNSDNIYLNASGGELTLTDEKLNSSVMIEAPSFNSSGTILGTALQAKINDISFKTIIDSSISYLELTNSTSTCEFGYRNPSNNALHILNSDNIYLNASGGELTLTDEKLNSSVMIEAPSFNATSDYRTKTNIEELDENITVSNLRPLVYLKNGQKEIGLIAHELQEVYPFMVCGKKDGKEMQSVNYNGLIGVLINDVKRLNNENDTLKSEINEIKSRFDSLEEKLNKKFE